MSVPKHVDENLEKAAYLYGFEVPKAKAAPVVKVAALQEDDYLIPAIKKFPVRSKEDGYLVQNILIKNAHIMGYDHLSEASLNLITKMASYKVEAGSISPLIYKYAGLTLSNKELLDASILRRTDFIQDLEAKDSYTKLASIVEDMDFNRINLLKVASVLEKLDDKYQMRRLYDKHILNPIESVFNTTKVFQIKKAGQELFTPEMAEMVSEDQVKTLLGDEVLNESLIGNDLDRGRLADVVNSLPTDMIVDFIERIS